MTETANYYLRVNLFVAVPAAIGLFVLAQPIVELLFLRGRFTMADAVATAQLWLALTPALQAASLSQSAQVLARAREYDWLRRHEAPS